MISVIVPTLNEETCIAQCLEAVLLAAGASQRVEVILVDGGSTDATVEISLHYCRIIHSAPGRALQMNRGAEEARGDILLFLHADVILPKSGLASINAALADARVLGGNFDITYEGRGFIPLIFTWINRWRRPFGIFYGDSGIFLRADAFRKLGGYRNLPLMEDYDLARRLWKMGRTVCLRDSLCVSSRRWEEYSLFRTLAAWFFLHVFYYLHIPQRFWGRLYPPIRRSVSTELKSPERAVSGR